jgi:hypothetical protein
MPGSEQQANQILPSVKILGGIGSAPYFNPLAFAAVTTPTFGNAGFNSLRGPGEVNDDFNLSRTFKIKERFTLRFRVDVYNLTNTPHFAVPGCTTASGLNSCTNNNNVSNMVLNSDGSVKSLGGYDQVVANAITGRDGIDARQFNFSLRIGF